MERTLEQLLEAVHKAGYRVFLLGNPLGQGWVLDAIHATEAVNGKPVYKTARGGSATEAAENWVFHHGGNKKGSTVPSAARAALQLALDRNLAARKLNDVFAESD